MMLTLSSRNQIIIGLVLTLLMVATRSHHFATLMHLPDASWAVFFLAGFYLRSNWALPGFLALTWVLDFSSFTWGGGSGFCLTRAYGFLLPAYSALWFAGYWFAKQYHFEWRTLMPLVVAVLMGSAVCEVFSSGGFYFFSGHFIETGFTEFAGQLIKYYPSYLQSMAFYVSIAAAVHVLFVLAFDTAKQKDMEVR
jgi:hypothetical protein